MVIAIDESHLVFLFLQPRSNATMLTAILYLPVALQLLSCSPDIFVNLLNIPSAPHLMSIPSHCYVK